MFLIRKCLLFLEDVWNTNTMEKFKVFRHRRSCSYLSYRALNNHSLTSLFSFSKLRAKKVWDKNTAYHAREKCKLLTHKESSLMDNSIILNITINKKKVMSSSFLVNTKLLLHYKRNTISDIHTQEPKCFILIFV